MSAYSRLEISPLVETIQYYVTSHVGTNEEHFENFPHHLSTQDVRMLEEAALQFLRQREGQTLEKDAGLAGQTLFRALIPLELRKRLAGLAEPLLIVTSLDRIPWEFLHDGHEFWGLQYCMGRHVLLTPPLPMMARHRHEGTPARRPRALVVGSDPHGTLPAVGTEVTQVAASLRRVNAETTILNSTSARHGAVLYALGDGFDLIHYCGHVCVTPLGEPALLLDGGAQLTATIIQTNTTGSPLVFLNGCDPDRVVKRPAGDQAASRAVAHLGYSFLYAGAGGVVATVNEVLDEQAAHFANRFYDYALMGHPIGEALRLTRVECRRDDPHSPTWLSFFLLGNPTFRIPKPDAISRPLFASNGELAGDTWHSDALAILARARSEARGHRAQSVSPVDLMAALAASSLFQQALASWGGAAARVPGLLTKLLHKMTSSDGPAPMDAAPMRRDDFDAETLAILATAGAAQSRPVQSGDLLLALLDTELEALRGLLDQLIPDREALRAVVARLTEQAEQGRVTVPDIAPATAPAPDSAGADELPATPPTPNSASAEAMPAPSPPSERVFDAFGQLRDAALSEPVRRALTAAAAEAASLGDEQIEPVHVFVALAASSGIQAELGIPASRRRAFERALRLGIYGVLGKKAVTSSKPMMPERRFFSPAVQEALDQVARTSGLPLAWQPIFDTVVDMLRPQLEEFTAEGGQRLGRVLGDFLSSLATQSQRQDESASSERTASVDATPTLASATDMPSEPESSLLLAAPIVEQVHELVEAEFDRDARSYLIAASRLAGAGEVSSTHLAAAMLEHPRSRLGLALSLQQVSPASVLQRLSQHLRRRSEEGSLRIGETLQATLHAAARGCGVGVPIGESHLAVALLSDPGAPLGECLDQIEVSRQTLIELVRLTPDMLARRVAMPFLYRYGRDLTEEAQLGRIPPLIGRRKELQEIGLGLARKDKASVLLVGAAGVGKTAIVEGLARSIAEGSAPQHLRETRIIAIDTGGIVAGTKFRGDLEARVQGIISETVASGHVVLFIDEFHVFVGAGGSGERVELSLGNQIKSHLARRGFSVIGATTEQEYALSVERDPALLRRFRIVRVPESTLEETLEILRQTKALMESDYQVSIEDESLIEAVALADRFLPGCMPDKARDVVMDSCARKGLEQPGSGDLVLRRADVRAMIAGMTGITLSVLPDPAQDAGLSFEAILASRVIGQDRVVSRVAARLRTARVVRDPQRPVAVLLFAGPSGVGKSELARAIATAYCGEAEAITTIPMNEFAEIINLSRLTGAGPGWVGHDEEPILVGALKRRPRSVILLDEIEKAHAEAWNMLLRLFDEGIIQDPRSNAEVSGREAVFIMTSNLNPAHTARIGFGQSADSESGEERRALLRALPREFVNRIDEVLVFDTLDVEAVQRIANLRLTELTGLVRKDHGIDLRFDPSVAQWIGGRAFTPEFGAREVMRLIQTEVREPLGVALAHTLRGASEIVGILRNDRLVFERPGERAES